LVEIIVSENYVFDQNQVISPQAMIVV